LLKSLTWGDIAILNDCAQIGESRPVLLLSAKDAHELDHAGRFPTLELALELGLLFVSDTLDFYLAKLDLSELVLLSFTLLDDQAQVLLANLPVIVLLIHTILVLNLAQLPVLLVDHLLFVILALEEIFIDDIDDFSTHLFLFSFICFAKLLDNLLIAVLEFTCVLDLRI